MTFPSGLRALNHTAFRRFFLAQWVALVCGWMHTVSQSWLVLTLTDSPLRLGLLGTLQFAPILLFSIFTGAVADRVPKRRLLMATQVTLAALALVLAALVLSKSVRYWHVAVVAVLAGLAQTFDGPARQSFMAEMVGKADLVNAVALNSAAFNSARIVGPALAGMLIGRFGVVPSFVINAAGLLGVVLALATLPERARAAPRGTTMLQEIGEGVRYAARTPVIRLVLGLLFVVSITVFNFTVYVPLLARHVLGLGPEGFGFLMAALGMGAVAGALTVGFLRAPEPPLAVMLTAATIALGGLLSLSAARHVAVAVLLLFVTGFFGLILVASCNTRLQLTAPDELRGRVMSLYTLVWGGVFPIGAFSVGAISEVWGVSTAFFVQGTAGFTGLALLVLWWRRRSA
ncbi:MAG: MFS transporter [Candidatus Rokuibacteriota bacterium]|nr:MAG: MFS transporter [Candidatus Rokubacteria bacterium]